MNPWHVTRRRIAKGALVTVYNLKTPNSPLCTMAAVSICLDKANLPTQCRKTLGFTLFDLRLRHLPHIGVCQKYTTAYGP